MTLSEIIRSEIARDPAEFRRKNPDILIANLKLKIASRQEVIASSTQFGMYPGDRRFMTMMRIEKKEYEKALVALAEHGYGE